MFEGKTEPVTQALQAIKQVLFFPDSGRMDEQSLLYQGIEQKVACQNINSEMDDENLEDLRHLYFEETEEERDIKEEPTTKGIHLLPLITKKVNIGTEDRPKLPTIGDY